MALTRESLKYLDALVVEKANNLMEIPDKSTNDLIQIDELEKIHQELRKELD